MGNWGYGGRHLRVAGMFQLANVILFNWNPD